MREKLDQLILLTQELEAYQNDPFMNDPESVESSFVKEILKNITAAVKDKSADAQITAQELSDIGNSCIHFKLEILSTTVNQIKVLCTNELSERKSLCHPTITFILDFKMISKPEYLNVERYNPHIIPLLKQILQTEDPLQVISQLPISDILEKIRLSKYFINHDLTQPLKRHFFRIQSPFKSLLESPLVTPRRHDATEMVVDSKVLERFQRISLYENSFSRSAPVLRSTPTSSTLVTSRSLPNSPKDPQASEALAPTLLIQYPQSSPCTSSSTRPIVPPLKLSGLPNIHKLSLNEEHQKSKSKTTSKKHAKK